MERLCHQVNLQPGIGGGEIYTRFFTRALAALGWRSELFAARGARFWRSLDIEADIVEVADEAELRGRLPEARSIVVTHTTASVPLAQALAGRHLLAGFVHMPLYDREPRGLRFYHRVFGVSRHVMDSARAKGLDNLHPEPLYGVADLAPRGRAGVLLGRSPYEWDRRKARDRLLGFVETLLPGAFAPARPFERRADALTLGIVSRLTPIKQFPRLFQALAPVIARYPQVRLEIFGAGGYASVRDLRQALKPCAGQVMLWGHQADVRTVYGQLDYVLSGLPEKEALGLNLIEAQAAGTPVLAVRAPPFTETVSEGRTGFFYADPREDGGASFAGLLEALLSQPRPDPRSDAAHLAVFSEQAFRDRVARAMAALESGAA
jgi:glycosyltransferase involved in cell wall biosynthesis